MCVLPRVNGGAFRGSSRSKVLGGGVLHTLNPLALVLTAPRLNVDCNSGNVAMSGRRNGHSPTGRTGVRTTGRGLLFHKVRTLSHLLGCLSSGDRLCPSCVRCRGGVANGSPYVVSGTRTFRSSNVIGVSCSAIAFHAVLPALHRLRRHRLHRVLPRRLLAHLLTGGRLSTGRGILLSRYIHCMTGGYTRLCASRAKRSRHATAKAPRFGPVVHPICRSAARAKGFFTNRTGCCTNGVRACLARGTTSLNVAVPSTAVGFGSGRGRLFASVSWSYAECWLVVVSVASPGPKAG